MSKRRRTWTPAQREYLKTHCRAAQESILDHGSKSWEVPKINDIYDANRDLYITEAAYFESNFQPKERAGELEEEFAQRLFSYTFEKEERERVFYGEKEEAP